MVARVRTARQAGTCAGASAKAGREDNARPTISGRSAAPVGVIAQYQCTKGTKTEVLDTAFTEAKKADKLVLYIGNKGG